MKDTSRLPRIEARWPVILAILVTFGLLSLLPERIRLLPSWILYFIGIIVIVPIIAVSATGAKAGWARLEKIAVLFFFVVVGTGTIVNLTSLIYFMVRRAAGISGLQLLTSSIAVWVTNILLFSLLYWQLDRGGPENRAKQTIQRTDWLFPNKEAAKDISAGWEPVFVDYLFLAYTTATAFSPTDVLPLTSRAKMLMMLESVISLMTILLVASRAINTLG